MRRTLATLVALSTAVGLTFALAPAPVVRHTPELPATAAPDAAGLLAVDLVDGSGEAELVRIEALLGSDLDWTHAPAFGDDALAEGWVADIDDAMALLASESGVEAVEPVLELHALGFPNDPLYDKQWNMRQMGAPAGWAASPMGQGVVVAVIDTGVAKVEDFDGTTLLEGKSFVPGTYSAADDQGHGTHVAGTIAQATNNGKGVVGVAPDAMILPVKVLSKFGSGSSTWIAAGIDYAADQGADVINLSLGGPYSLIIHNAIKKARDKGIIVVAAAGNSGRRGVGYPGALAETIGVSATGPGGSLAPYSSYGKGVDIAAPGGDKRKPGGGVLQDTIDGRGGHIYAEYQGTSMATPHVAGAAAVLLSQGIPASEVQQTLMRAARGDGTWNERYGYGQLDLGSALSYTQDTEGGTRFALGVLFALLVAQLAGSRSMFRNSSAAIAGVVAGGLFFLHYLPLPNHLVVQLLSQGLLSWPALLVGPEWAQFPLWLSALLPGMVVFTLGTARVTRPIALGVACGVAAHLFHGAATGSLEPWWMPASLGALWLGLNGTTCVLLALAVAGAEKMASRS